MLVILYKFYIKYVFGCKGIIKFINHQTKIRIFMFLSYKKLLSYPKSISKCNNKHGFLLKKENAISCRNIFVAASSMPFNLIATPV